MSRDKRFMAWKRHHRKRKAAKAKVQAYEQGKVPHHKLSALAQQLLRRRRRFQKRASA